MKTKQINLRIPEDELSAWKANANGMSLTDWIRQRCKLTPANAKIDLWTDIANKAGMSLDEWITGLVEKANEAVIAWETSKTEVVKIAPAVTPKGEPVAKAKMLTSTKCKGCGRRLLNGAQCEHCKLTPVTD